MKKSFTAVLAAALLPLAARAQALSQINNANDLFTRLAGLGNMFVYGLVALAVIFIVWQAVVYLARPGAEDKAKAGVNILWGIVGLFIIVSIWGLVNILVNSFSTGNSGKVNIPNVDFINNNNGSGGVNATQVQYQTPSAANNFNTVTGGDSNTQNYNH